MDEAGIIISRGRAGLPALRPVRAIDPLHFVGASAFADRQVGVMGWAHHDAAAAYGAPAVRRRRPRPRRVRFQTGRCGRVRPIDGGGQRRLAGRRSATAWPWRALEVLRHLNAHRTKCGSSSVCREVGSRGVRTAAYGLEPEVGLMIGAVPAGDVPRGLPAQISLGNGPVIRAREGLALSDPRIVEWMVTRAGEARLPHQLGVFDSSASEPAALQVSRAGIVTGGLGLPCRYMNTGSEIVDLSDAENAVKLLLSLLASPLPF
jgi:hypothetical protein